MHSLQTKLHLNELPFVPEADILTPLTAAADASNRYPEWDGITLRTALAKHMGVTPESVVVSGGGSIGVIQQAMVASGMGEVIYAWPTFEAFELAAKALRMPIQHVGLKDNACDLDELAQAITDQTSIVIICTPNAPTGGIVKQSDFEAFMKRVPEHIVVLIDEAYAEFVNDPAAIQSIACMQKYPNVVVTRTFSKAYGLAGIRVGYGIAQPKLAGKIAKAGLPFPVSLPYQQAAIGALAHPEILHDHIKTVQTERGKLARQLRTLGADVVESYANFLWLPVGDAAEKIAGLFREEGVLVKAVMPHGVRITIGTPKESAAVCAAWKKVAAFL